MTDVESSGRARARITTAPLLAVFGTSLVATGGSLSKLTNGSGAAAECDTSFIRFASHRSREMKYYFEHPERFEHLIGEWVAVEGQAMIAHGFDAAEVVSEAKRKGVKVPFVFRVESKVGSGEGMIGL